MENGGNKGAWFVDAYRRIAADPSVNGVVYFNYPDQRARLEDWRVGTTLSSLQGFRSAIAPKYFVAGVPAVLTRWLRALTTAQRSRLASLKSIY